MTDHDVRPHDHTAPEPSHLPADEFMWLEDIHGEPALEWVRRQNEVTGAMLESDGFRDLEQRVLQVLDSTDRIPMVIKRGEHYYNFWRDEDNPRGLWRRTSWESYCTDSPQWDVLLDLDELSRAEQTEWVWAGAKVLRPVSDGEPYRRALIGLSPDGGDAVRYREFDLQARRFVPDGFDIPTAKSRLGWAGPDTLYVGTDFGPGSMTSSSYPRTTRILQRGQQLADAAPYFEVPEDHLMGVAGRDLTPGFERDIAIDVIDFFSSRTYIRLEEGTTPAAAPPAPGGEWVHIDVPDGVNVQVHREWLVLRPREDWPLAGTVHTAGSLLAIGLDRFLAGKRDLHTLFRPDPSTSLQSWSWTRDFLLLNLLADVSSEIRVLDPAREWTATVLDACPPLHSVDAYAVDDEDALAGNDYWLVATGFLTPSTLSRGSLGSASGSRGAMPPSGITTVKTAPSFFTEDDYSVSQHFATSADGTRVPYFQVAPHGLVLDGGNPTILSGYGGFEVSRTPAYSGTVGRAWLERRTAPTNSSPVRGGVYVLANIRGGGEYGPGWHQAALQENRHRAYEDFAAVARNLIARGVTSPAHLGCSGGSNGGLLVGNMLTLYPELFGAISCGVPLLDMARYTRLSAGASWIAEYGDPDDPSQWEFIRTFSPYHLLRQDVEYPPTFIWTATSDDRVGPVQARKMAARMQALGIGNVWFHEALEGGHAGASDNRQAARLQASSHEFLWKMLTRA